MSREALKLALEALEGLHRLHYARLELHELNAIHKNHERAITAIKQALAAPVQEPVAWMHVAAQMPSNRHLEWNENHPGYRGDWIKHPLYTTPPAAPVQEFECPRCGHCCGQRQWVGLTKTVVGNHLRRHALGDQSTFRQGFKEGVAFAELKLKEKNT